MVKSVKVLNKHSQIRALGSELKFNILKELITGSATCQQLADIFGFAKQKIHYSLKQLLKESLIEIVPEYSKNNKEVYYRSAAKNFVLDFSFGPYIPEKKIYSRELINTILKNEYRIDLGAIAAKLIDQSLKVKPNERLLIITGRYNMPLAEKIVIESIRRNIKPTLHYQGLDVYQSIHDEYSLAAVKNYFDNRYNLFKNNDAVLILNGEASSLKEYSDPYKRELDQKHQNEINQLFSRRQTEGFRVAVMLGFLLDNLSESNLSAEMRFWRSLDIDYQKLQNDTKAMVEELRKNKNYRVKKDNSDFVFTAEHVFCEPGSYDHCPSQSPLINLPGGEVLIVPQKQSFNGVIASSNGYVMGQHVSNIRVVVENNQIVSYVSEKNRQLIQKAIDNGGADGRKIALVCIGANDNLNIDDVSPNYRHKAKGLMSIYWGNNTMFGGDVQGYSDWFIELEHPEFTPSFGLARQE